MINGNLPSLNEIITKIKLVLENKLTREEVSDWAGSYVLNDELEVENNELWNLLNLVFGMDIKDSPTEYLHTSEELKDWIEKYKNTNF